MVHLLIIDDENAMLPDMVRYAFPAPRNRVEVAHATWEGLNCIVARLPDVILLNLRLSDQHGLEALRHSLQIITKIRRATDARVPVIFITASPLTPEGRRSADSAIEAMRQGAYDYLLKPLDLKELERVINDAVKVAKLMREPAIETPNELDTRPLDVDDDASSPVSNYPESGIVGCCPGMRRICKAIGRVADQTFPVLITGESGTGKELVARAIFQHGTRAKAPFLALNCAAIPEQLLESELFGHEKGAFTGADRRRIGKFEQCDGGTIFLDEIGDMPLALQAKVLRLLHEQAFERIGGNETIRTDVRLIAATHRDLMAWSAEGKFRPDLYYRLNVFTINLPPLRERGNDLPLLVQHYLRRFSRELGREVRQVAPEALDRLRRYSWPGNIRELQSVLKQALLQASGAVLLPTYLPEILGGHGETDPSSPSGKEPGMDGMETFVVHQRLAYDVRDLYMETHRQVDRALLARVLEYTHGNLQQAALVLGIARQTLRQKLRELGLSAARPDNAEGCTTV